jgi:Tol biopolymer transport system component
MRSTIRTLVLLPVAAAWLGFPQPSLSQAARTKALTIENIFGGQGGGGVRQVTISPDGKVIAMSGDGPAGSGVYVTAPGESAPKLWFQGNVAAWFPDSQRVLFSRQSDLWAMRIGSTEATQVTRDKENERAPSISPDGRWIAFYSSRSGHQDIWLVPSDGSAPPKALTQAAMAEDDARFSPAWSPDSRQIAYISNKSDYWHDDVWVVDTPSGKSRQLSKSLMAASTPAWAPDGRSMALLGTAKKGYWYEDLQDIWILDAASGAERTVKMQIPATDWLHSLPVYWSGDGRHLYFVYHERGDLNLWVVPSGGGVATRITNERPRPST